ncbi:MAG: SPOR domain-containing protein [Thermohalobaculum sp.]
MITQTGNRSCRRGRDSLVRIAIGAMILSMSGCAEIELGAEAYKTYAQANEPPPVSPRPARQDSIDPSMHPDPSAFHAADLAQWDGVRTLPGIWIAHPMAETARRVRLTNGETGAQVDAAMFRRDPNLSGPRIIVSSEAAERLGLMPGHATPVTIEGLAYRVDTEAAAVVAGAAVESVPTPAEVLAEAIAAGPGASVPTPDGTGDITDGRHFIQAGVFGQPEIAARLVEKLRAADLPASELPLTLGERQLTRVLVGPYRTIAERDSALETVRKLGPADATPARG